MHPDLHPSLDPLHVTLFLKRLRKRGQIVRYFMCGEYGSNTLRPHYHMIIYGLVLTDLEPLSRGLSRSPWLDQVWGLGTIAVGAVTPESIAYCCRYTMKKALGRPRQWYLDRGMIPEYVRMSRNPGIGADFFRRYRDDVYNTDSCWLPSGFRAKVPRYYDKLLEASDPVFLHEEIKPARAARKAALGFDPLYPDMQRNFSRDLIARSRLALKSDVF